MKKAVSIAVGMGFLAAATVFGSGASAAPGAAPGAAPPSTQAAATCTGSWVKALAPLKLRSRPDAASVDMADVIEGELRACRKQVTGSVYKACGVTGATSWVMVQVMDLDPRYPRGWSGYLPATCLVDHS
ncbi:hypothetical protein ACTG9Q_14820 [Actinokineospora sp. 24-640]